MFPFRFLFIHSYIFLFAVCLQKPVCPVKAFKAHNFQKLIFYASCKDKIVISILFSLLTILMFLTIR